MASEQQLWADDGQAAPEEEPFEVLLERLERIVRQLERGEASLEDSLKLFEEGVRLSRLCTARLDRIQGRVEVLLEQTEDGPVIRPFEVPGATEGMRGGDG